MTTEFCYKNNVIVLSDNTLFWESDWICHCDRFVFSVDTIEKKVLISSISKSDLSLHCIVGTTNYSAFFKK